MDISVYKNYLSNRNLSENTISSYVYDVESFNTYLYDEYALDLTETNFDISCESSKGWEKFFNHIKNYFRLEEFF